MRLWQKAKDGGPKSPVDAFFLIECKWLFSIALLRFNPGTRSEYHSHAFHAWTWFLWGEMYEDQVFLPCLRKYKRGFFPKVTRRDNLHRVKAERTSWCFTIRGPWQDTWIEYNHFTGETTTLTHGRKVVDNG